MRLHYAPGTISIAVAIALHEAGLPFDAIPVDFRARAQTLPEYRRINPKGRVPALEVPDGILTETGAILDYIAAVVPTAKLMSEDPFQAARLRGVMYYLASTMHVNHAHRLRASRWADSEAAQADMRAKVPQTMAVSCAYVEDYCLSGPFITGAQITVADPYLFVVCNWLEGDGIDVTAYPRIAAFRAAMEARPSVKAARAAGMLP